MGKLGWLTLAIIASTAGGVAHAQAVRARPKAVNSAVHTMQDAHRAWARYRSRSARLKGSIAIDPAVHKAVLGSCNDIVVQVVSPQWNTVAAVQAFGNLRDGACSYSVIVPARRGLRVRGFYAGPSGAHPGDFLELTAGSNDPLSLQVGATTQMRLQLSYQYVQ